MSSRYWVKLFMNTLLIGGVSAGVVGLIAKWNEFSIKTPVELLVGFLWMAGVGLIFNVSVGIHLACYSVGDYWSCVG